VIVRSTLVVLAVAAGFGVQPQREPEIETLVSRLGAYLVEYEPQLSTLVARERYRQSETRPVVGQNSLAGGIGSVRTRTLESEVAFSRLPGNQEWYGVRDVRHVNGRPVDPSQPRLLDAMKAPAMEQKTLVQAIVRASAAHNLGPSRTTNMPTVPLELLHPKHRARFVFRSAGTATISGTSTRELRFRERVTPTLIQDVAGKSMRAEGSAWIDPAHGRLWRVVLRLEMTDQSLARGATGANELRVDFAHDATLDLLVPKELREELSAQGGGHLQGRATYSEFRRFTTSARIIPPP
jgi:hypothetical protein